MRFSRRFYLPEALSGQPLQTIGFVHDHLCNTPVHHGSDMPPEWARCQEGNRATTERKWNGGVTVDLRVQLLVGLAPARLPALLANQLQDLHGTVGVQSRRRKRVSADQGGEEEGTRLVADLKLRKVRGKTVMTVHARSVLELSAPIRIFTSHLFGGGAGEQAGGIAEGGERTHLLVAGVELCADRGGFARDGLFLKANDPSLCKSAPALGGAPNCALKQKFQKLILYQD